MSSSASSVARAGDFAFRSSASVMKVLERLADRSVALLLIDLQMPGLNIEELHSGLEAIDQADRPHSVAYAQHVNIENLQQAKQCCFDEVLTRGQINAGLGDLMTEWGKR